MDEEEMAPPKRGKSGKMAADLKPAKAGKISAPKSGKGSGGIKMPKGKISVPRGGSGHIPMPHVKTARPQFALKPGKKTTKR